MPLRVFPVAGNATFSDDFAAPRGGHSHQGIDIFAAEGTPVRAVDDGRVRYDENKLGGHTAYVKASDGTTSYYYAHLSSYEGAARPVKAGDVIGYVGHTGNAANTPPHLHFQVSYSAGGTANPYELLAAVAPPGSTNTRAGPVSAPGTARAGVGGGLGLLLLLYALSKR